MHYRLASHDSNDIEAWCMLLKVTLNDSFTVIVICSHSTTTVINHIVIFTIVVTVVVIFFKMT